MAEQEKLISFKDTLNLPRTDFSIRPNAAIDDPAMIVRWEIDQLYHKTFEVHAGAQKYVLHVGPPYANGHIHLGHAYNFILKDIITKSYRMSGYHTPVTPGWDCHGLPIEIKVAQAGQDLSRIELKKACRTYAEHWVDTQRSEFKRLGILMDWDRPYITMAPSYEASTMRAFGKLVEGGFIQRKNKTVPWCFSCRTVLASAEIEYHDRKDPSIYVLFPLESVLTAGLFPEAHESPISLLVWTTTPWTLPLNRAVILKPGAEYVLAHIKNQRIICGALALPAIEKMVGETAQVLKRFTAELLAGVSVRHPFIDDLIVPILFDESVGLDEGTACVHSAPGCGPIDYEIGVKNKLDIFSPLSPDGRYTDGIQPEELKGMLITDAQGAVIKLLSQRDRLFHKASVTHSYPHCWRCHTGLMFRATRQWFFNLEHREVKKRALEAVENITFLPPQGKNFLRATIENRWEWCLSRQRVWGVPIPALLCTGCDYVFNTPEFIQAIADGVAQEGVEYWDRVSLDDLINEYHVVCPHCKTSDFIKEQDILDVWFDSGVSHYAVLYNNPELAIVASGRINK